MNQERLVAAESMAMDIAAPLPAIMTLVEANEDEGRAAIMILLRDVNIKLHDLCEVLSDLQRDTEPAKSA
jgi:hypothetical protein